MRFRLSAVTLAITSALFTMTAAAQNWTFDASQLGGDVSNADIALFNQGGELPGTYHVDIILNGETVDTGDVVFRLVKNKQGEPELQPCLSRAQLSRYGVKVEAYPGLTPDQKEGCVAFDAIPQASTTFNFSQQQLLLSIPQAALRVQNDDIAPRIQWDDGLPALLLNYQVNHTRTEARGAYHGREESTFLQLEPGANLGPWRLRNSTTWQQEANQPGRWQSAYTYVERGLYDSKSRLTLGERFTPAEIFDSVPFRGVMLGTDENMVPFSQRRFSPVVRGIARTQARVEVKQNGYTLYNATVAPGPFALDNLPAGNTGGDLQVTVWETDGNPQVFIVPYQTPAIALHEGHMVYNLMAGEYRSSMRGTESTPVAQATLMYGLPAGLTLYGGSQWSQYYQAATAGVGLSLGEWGGLSLDGTASHGERKGARAENGGSWRLRYSKSVAATNTTLALTSYQYATTGYSTLADVLDTYRSGATPVYSSSNKRQSRTTLSLSQPLGDLGYLTLNGSRDTYRAQGSSTAFGAGYSLGINGMTFSLNWTQNNAVFAGEKKNDRIVSLMVSMPLDRWLNGSARANYQLTSPSTGSSTQQVSLNGQAYDHQLQWNLSQRYRSGTSGDRNNSAVQLGWSHPYGQIDGSYSYSPTSQQMAVDLSGGMVVTRDGLTLSQPIDGSVALVEAPGASGVPAGGWSGVKTDYRGYTTVSSLQPYQQNTISLDPEGLSADAEITQTDVKVVPTEGAIVPATFNTHIGERGLIHLLRADGKAVPFGALISAVSEPNADTGITDEKGQVYLSGLTSKGVLDVKWGQSKSQQCRAEYRLSTTTNSAGIHTAEAVCR